MNTSKNSTIRVAPVDAPLRLALLGLHVRPAQRDWVGAIADLLADVAQCTDSEPMAILQGDVPVGYYRLEPNGRSVARRDFGMPSLGLRAFFIDACRQGRGLGALALAALIVDVVERHPQARLLALTVNCDNHVALQLYLHAGFTDSGELYHGGRCGPQRLLLCVLP